MSSTIADRLARRDAQRFVGRERELAFFESLLVDDPPAQVVLLHGPGGIGKSTLLREVARRAAKRGWSPTLVEGRDVAPLPGEIEKAINGVAHTTQPLVLFDTYERISAADGWLRGRLIPSLPARSLIVLAGRLPPDAAWFQDGWERLTVELKLAPLNTETALRLVKAHGLHDDDVARQIVAWAEGSPLALALAADAAQTDGGRWSPDAMREHPNLARALVRRLAQTELDGGNFDVAAVAAIARTTDARLIRDVLPELDPDEAYSWLASRTFAERVSQGVVLHDLVREAMRADLRARDPDHDRALRRRIADHLHTRALRGEPRLAVDLAELVESPTLRWGFGADGTTTYRPDLYRPEDAPVLRNIMVDDHGATEWWRNVQPLLIEAPERIVTVRDQQDRLCGLAIAVTPHDAPPAAERDVVLGPWLAHARTHHANDETMIWRDSLDFVAHGDLTSPVLAILNTAAALRSGLTNPRFSYLPIDPTVDAAMQFATATGAQHQPELDVIQDGRVQRCYVFDAGAGGLLGGVHAMVYAELGLPARPHHKATTTTTAEKRVTVADVRDALRNLHHPLDLAASPLATGDTPTARAASVRAAIDEAVAAAFGASADEQLLRGVLERGYLDPAGGHEAAADELHVSRATYFRRLRAASERVAEWLVAQRQNPA